MNRVDIRSKFLKIGRVSLRFTTMLVKTDFSFLWGGSKNAPPTHPRRVDNFGFVIQVYEFFGGNKSKFLDQNCIFFDGKPKMTKIFGFEIWKRLKRANFEQFWKSPFFSMISSGFRGQFFLSFLFFFEKIIFG